MQHRRARRIGDLAKPGEDPKALRVKDHRMGCSSDLRAKPRNLVWQKICLDTTQCVA